LEYRVTPRLGVALPCGHTPFVEKNDDKCYESPQPVPGQAPSKPTKLATEGLWSYAQEKFSIRAWNALSNHFEAGIEFSMKAPIEVACPVCGHTQAMK
jgi:hypothetical protein